MVSKLRRLKCDLRKWSNDSFGSIFDNVKKAKLELLQIQNEVDLSSFDNGLHEVVRAQHRLDMAIRQEEMF